jgi:tripartite-type tricarboxylate transporter receptor subunit TctC
MMKLPRRRFLHLAAGAAAVPALSRSANAQAYPTQPVRIIVAFAAGSGSGCQMEKSTARKFHHVRPPRVGARGA